MSGGPWRSQRGSFSPAETAKLQELASIVDTLPGNAYAQRRLDNARKLQAARQFPGPTMSFPFREGTGQVVYEQCSQRPATLNFGSLTPDPAKTVTWDPDRGVLFNGSSCFQFPSPMIRAQAAQISDLSTLAVGEEITVACVYSHAGNLSGQHPLFYFGLAGENTRGGWGVMMKNGNLCICHRAVGSATEVVNSISNRKPGNDTADNTLSAFCFALRVSSWDPNFFELAYADRPLEVSAPINSTGFSCNAYLELTGDGGTGPARPGSLGTLTIGGQPKTNYTTDFAKIAGNGGGYVGLRQLHIQRYKWVPGRFHRILKDLAESYQETPVSLFMEA